jgi:hypothetical protein
MQVPLTSAQAAYLAQQVSAMRTAEQAFQQALALLTLGAELPDGAILSDINVDTGVLTFTVPEP